MTRADTDERRFYAALAERAEAEEYCPLEQVVALPNGTSTTAEELDALVRELFDSIHAGNAQ